VDGLFFVLDKLGGPRLLDIRPSQGKYEAVFALRRGSLALRAFGAEGADTVEVSQLGSCEPRVKLFNLAAVDEYELVFRDGSRDGEVREYRLSGLQLEPESLVEVTFLGNDGGVRVDSPLGTTFFDLELRREASGVAVAVTRPDVFAAAGHTVTVTPDDWSRLEQTSIEMVGTPLSPLAIESYVGELYEPSEGPVGPDFDAAGNIGAARAERPLTTRATTPTRSCRASWRRRRKGTPPTSCIASCAATSTSRWR